MIKCLAVFQIQSQYNHDYVLFVAKDGHLPIYLYSYRSGKWQEATEGLALFPDAVAAFQDAPSRNIEWFTVQDNQLQHSWWEMSWKQDWENQLQRGAIVGDASGGVAAFQNHAPSNLNYEVFAVRGDRLWHWWYDYPTLGWASGDVSL